MIFDVLGISFDETQTFRKGAGKFPKLFFETLSKMETYVEGIDLSERAFFNTLGIIQPEGLQELIDEVDYKLSGELSFPVIIGGEHTISFAALHSLKEKMHIDKFVCFDAHPDCEESNRHDGVIRKILPKLGEENIYLFGVRTMSKEEEKFLKNSKINLVSSVEELKKIKGNIYLSIDFDVFDPSILPTVGNPEPEGLSFTQVLEGVKAIAKNVVAIDFVEFTPTDTELDEIYVSIALNFILKVLAEIIKSKSSMI
jgi:agmatinase